MPMVTLTTTCNTNLSQTLSLENNHHLRDASFTSYLNDSDKSFVLKLAESSQNLDSLGGKKSEDGEIGIFGAEKYFNGGMDEEKPRISDKGATRYEHEKDEPVDIGPGKTKPPLGTQSVHSESSWNSQSMLLNGVQRNLSRRKTNKTHGKSFFASLGCSCSCNDKDSLDIDEHACENNSIRKGTVKTGLDSVDLVRTNKSQMDPSLKEEMHHKKFHELGLGLKREGCVSFSILNSRTGKVAEEDDEPRKSLEVFGSPILDKGRRTLSLERRLTTLSWDAIPRVEETEISASSVGMYNDTESDASSDLFEIESFKQNAKPFLARQASDGMSGGCLTPTTCYAPSEGSIEWTAVTASVADFSVMSDSEEQRTATNTNKMVPNAKTTQSQETRTRRPSLLSCKSQKSVRIAGDAYRTSKKASPEPRRHHRSDSFAPVTRFRAETKLTSIESRNRAQSARDLHFSPIQ